MNMAPKVLARDNFTCQFCGFKSPKYQEVHHINDDHRDSSAKNLTTACPLCHSCFHIGLAGYQDAGIIIHLDCDKPPTQPELNSLVRTLWISERHGSKAVATQASNMLARLFRLNARAASLLGTSDAMALGDDLLKMTDEQYRRRNLSGLYLLPLARGFEPEIEYWGKHVYRATPPDSLPKIAEQYASRWALSELGSKTPNYILTLLN